MIKKIKSICSRYSLRDDADGTFRIDPETGRITALRPLDREAIATYHLVAIATDGGIVSCETVTAVTVKVDDVNDNPPRFGRSLYEATLRDPTEEGNGLL